MLNLNKSIDTDTFNNSNINNNEDDELIWKILILDSKSTGIISSVLRVNDLLELGITMHALINHRRTQLLDVPVIYFVEPTTENISLILNDLENDKYSDFYINFTSNLNRSLLEEFAKKVSLLNKSFKIKQIFDQYLDFIVTEPNLFNLNLKQTYSILNNPKSTEDLINLKIDQISNNLFSTILTFGSIPIIRANKGGPAELIAIKLDLKLRDHVINLKRNINNNSGSSSNNNLLDNSNDSNCVLILLDRNINLSSMFSHSWIYQCMVSDVFKLDKNTIEIRINKNENGNGSENGSGNGNGNDELNSFEVKKFDIEPNDFFWIKNSSLPFPDAVENVEIELNNYTNDAKIITSKTGYSSINEIDLNDQSNTKHIQEAIKLLPELTHRKNIIDMHMTVLSNLIKELESKNLDSFFEIEQNLNNVKIQKQLLDLLSINSKCDNSLDKLRTFIIIYLNLNLPAKFLNECEEILKNLNIDLNPLIYIKKIKEFNKMNQISSLPSNLNNLNNNSNENSNALFSNLSSKLINLTDNGSKLSEGFGSIISGIKKLLPEKSNLPITNITESIMNPSNSNIDTLKLTDDYLYFNPNITRGSHSKQPKRKNYNEGIVFIVGGGNYTEYSNLQDWCNDFNLKNNFDNNNNNSNTNNNSSNNSNSLNNKLVCYGSTDIITANEFLKECGSLAN